MTQRPQGRGLLHGCACPPGAFNPAPAPAVGGLTRAAFAAANVTFDTGAGVVFTVNGTNGNLSSLRHNGVELASSGQAAGQFQSGWSSATVSSRTFDNGNSLLVSAANSSIGVT